MKKPSLGVMEIVAVADRSLFEHLMQGVGLQVVGFNDGDPLRSSIQSESVTAIASIITEDIHETNIIDPYRRQVKTMAEELGYIVAIDEGLDQFPGSDPNPIKIQMRHPPEKQPQPPQDDEEGGPPVP